MVIAIILTVGQNSNSFNSLFLKVLINNIEKQIL